MSKQHFALGESENRRPTLPPAMVNRPILMVSAAAAFSLFAAVMFTLLDRAPSAARSERSESSPNPPESTPADKSSRLEVAVPPPQAFVQPPVEPIDAPVSVPAPVPAPAAASAQAFTPVPAPASASAQAFTPVPPIVNRRADPASMRSSGEVAGEAADVTGEAPIQRKAAAIDPDEARPRQAISSRTGAPIECLPGALRAVLTDLEARFGPVTIVSTTHLHTDNHSRGSAREKMHHACKAVDIQTSKEPRAVIAYLRSRPEVGGVNTYGNRVIHFDVNANYKSTAGNLGRAQQRRATYAAPARRIRASARR